MIARIEAVAGKHRMSQFLREAAEAELLRREAKKVQKPKLGLEAAAASHDKPKPKKPKGWPMASRNHLTFVVKLETKRIALYAPAEWLKKINDWRRQQPDPIPNLSEAIRHLVDQALEAEGLGPPGYTPYVPTPIAKPKSWSMPRHPDHQKRHAPSCRGEDDMKHLVAIAIAMTTLVASSRAQAGTCEDAMASYTKDVAEDDAADTSGWAPGAKEANDKLNKRIKANILKGYAPGGFYDQLDEAIRKVKAECMAHPNTKGC
jgi:hypothetical protein